MPYKNDCQLQYAGNFDPKEQRLLTPWAIVGITQKKKIGQWF
jgi:hypothetical protein